MAELLSQLMLHPFAILLIIASAILFSMLWFRSQKPFAYDVILLTQELTDTLTPLFDREKIIRSAADILRDTIDAKGFTIIVYKEEKDGKDAYYQLSKHNHSYHDKLASDHPFIKYAAANHTPILAKTLLKEIQALKHEPYLTVYSVVIPLYSLTSLEGILILDEPLSRRYYHDQDLKTLELVAKEISVYLDRMKPYDQIKKDYAKILETDDKHNAQHGLSQVARQLGHEIYNPMQMILAHAELIEEQSNNKALIERSMPVIIESIQRLSTLARTFLRYGEDLNAQFQDMDLKKLLIQIKNLCEPECKKYQISLVDIIEEDLPNIQGDQTLLHVIFFNLVMNAIQAIKEVIEKDPNADTRHFIIIAMKLAQFVNKDGLAVESIKVDIQDTGPGIPDPLKQRIFDPCFTTNDVERTGLGLSMVLKYVLQHHGHIDIDSAADRGTTFSIYIPVKSV